MYTDLGLRLATAEVTPNAGNTPGGLGQASVTLAFEPGGNHPLFRSYADIGGGMIPTLAFNVDTTFASGTFGATMEIRLVSLPIAASLLDNTAAGAGAGKTLLKASVVLTDASDDATITGHNLPLGTPFFITSLATTTGVVNNVIYFAVPNGANTFQFAATRAVAVASTPTILPLTTNGTATVNFLPTVHASTGTLPIYNQPAGGYGPLVAGTRFMLPLRPLATRTGQQRLATGQTLKQPIASPPTLGQLATTAQRFYYLQYIPSAAITAGAITCDLVLCPDDALKTYATAVEVIG